MAFFKSIKRRIFNALSEETRHAIIRKAITLPMAIPAQYTFKVATTQAELEDAFRLVYKSYLEMGYCSENIHSMRATIYHALPSTTVLIAKDGDKVVGTLTVVRDNPMGLPMERVFNLKSLRPQADRLAEITSLVIDKEYRRQKQGIILFPLLKFMYEYTRHYFGVNRLMVAIAPKEIDFYKGLLYFTDVPGSKVQDYLGAPATILQLSFYEIERKYKLFFQDSAPEKNLYHFFVERSYANIQKPKRDFFSINDSIVDLKYYQSFFIEKMKLQDPRVATVLQGNKRKRFEFEAPARIMSEQDFHYGRISIKDVSEKGFRAYLETDIELAVKIPFRIEIAPGIFSFVLARGIWGSVEKGVGFEIIQSDENWQKLITKLGTQTELHP